MTAQGLPTPWAHELIKRLDARASGRGKSEVPYSPPLSFVARPGRD
jgi:hypothetical protein